MIEFDVLATGGVGILATFASGWCSYVFTRKKYRAEVDGNVIDNMQKSLEFYKNAIDNNKEVLADVQKENKELREENKKLQEQIDTYEEKLGVLEHSNKDLLDRISKLEKLVTKPKKITPKKKGSK